jgi:hypothetical protein
MSIQVYYNDLIEFYSEVGNKETMTSEEKSNYNEFLHVHDDVDVPEKSFGTQNVLSYMGFIMQTIREMDLDQTNTIKPSMDILINSLEKAGTPTSLSIFLDKLHLMILFSRILPKFNIFASCGLYSECLGFLKYYSLFSCHNLFQIRPIDLHPLLQIVHPHENIRTITEFNINCRIAVKYIHSTHSNSCHYEALDPIIWADKDQIKFHIDSDCVPKRPLRECKKNNAPEKINRQVNTKILNKKSKESRRIHSQKKKDFYIADDDDDDSVNDC